MTISEIIQALDLEIITGADNTENAVTGVYVSDLLSDVMGNAKQGQCWITLQAHANVLAVAQLKDLACVILVNNAKTDPAVVDKSREEGITLLRSKKPTFELAGKLYNLLQQ